MEPGAFRTDFLSTHFIHFSDQKISDYKESAYDKANYLRELDGKQIGDPQKAVDAIWNVASSNNPSMYLVLGLDALVRTREIIKNFNSEIDKWEKISLNTAFDE